MKKGLITTLAVVAIALTCVSATFAMAPTIRSIPDVQVSDWEDNLGTDNNWFVYTNAFKFDRYAQDGDTTVSELLWSFDEWAGPTETGWYAINNIQAVHVTNAGLASDSPVASADHVRPDLVGKDIRTGNQYASFRDIIFSPTTTPPFGSPNSTDKAQHAAGKKIRFYVSDKTNVATRDIWVNTVDTVVGDTGPRDAVSGGTPFDPYQDQTFMENVSNPTLGGTTGWTPINGSTNPAVDYDSVNDALRATVTSGASDRVNGWISANAEWMPYTTVGAANVARVKFYMFATGQSNPSDLNQIPNFRLRVAQRFAVISILEIFHHLASDPGITPMTQEYRPSTDPNNPSIYRVDLDPIDVANMNNPGEGISRAFEAYSLSVDPQENGAIEMTECIIGTYPTNLVPNAPTGLPGDLVTKSKTYAVSGGGLGTMPPVDSATELTRAKYLMLPPGGVPGAPEALGTNDPQYAEGAAGISVSTTAVLSDRIGIVSRDVTALGANTDRVRFDPGKQYKVRFHAVSTSNSNSQPQFRLRAFGVKFSWVQKMELGGSLAAGGTNNGIAAQALPGVGSANPDKDGTEAGGYYNVMLHSPLSSDIRASQPLLNAQPGSGDPLPASGASRRDIKFGIGIVDSITPSANAYVETGMFTVDKVSILQYDLIPD